MSKENTAAEKTTRKSPTSRNFSVEKSRAIRKSTIRKNLTAEIRRLEKVRAGLEKASEVITKNTENIQGDTGDQIASVLRSLTNGLVVVNAEIGVQANALAATFLK